MNIQTIYYVRYAFTKYNLMKIYHITLNDKAFNLQEINVLIHIQNTLSITLSSDFIDEDETTNTNLRNKII